MFAKICVMKYKKKFHFIGMKNYINRYIGGSLSLISSQLLSRWEEGLPSKDVKIIRPLNVPKFYRTI